MLKVGVLDNCVGCGACAIINPEVFEMRNDKATVNFDNIVSTQDLCIDAAITCPVNAIVIDEY